MVVGIFGESCTGKSTFAGMLVGRLGAPVYTGKDYLRLAKSESEAKRAFQELLRQSPGEEHILYVITEKEHLSLLPEGAVRVLVTAPLELIQERFAKRTGGVLPAPVATMLERKHGLFDREPHEVHIISGETDLEEACAAVLNRINS